MITVLLGLFGAYTGWTIAGLPLADGQKFGIFLLAALNLVVGILIGGKWV